MTGCLRATNLWNSWGVGTWLILVTGLGSMWEPRGCMCPGGLSASAVGSCSVSLSASQVLLNAAVQSKQAVSIAETFIVGSSWVATSTVHHERQFELLSIEHAQICVGTFFFVVFFCLFCFPFLLNTFTHFAFQPAHFACLSPIYCAHTQLSQEIACTDKMYLF